MSNLYSPKDPTETAVCSMDFSPDIVRVGGVLTACVVDVLREDGTVQDLSSMVVGAADLTSAPVVRQKIAGGVHGVSYIVRFTATINSLLCVGSARMLAKLGG